MTGQLTDSEIDTVLRSNLLGRIAFYADGRSYIVPISYAYDGRYLYMHSREGLKLDMMRKNPGICFQVDEMKDMANWKSVIAWGTAEELHDHSLRTFAVKKLNERTFPARTSNTVHLSPEWPFAPSDVSEIKGVFLRVFLTERTGRFETSHDPLVKSGYPK